MKRSSFIFVGYYGFAREDIYGVGELFGKIRMK